MLYWWYLGDISGAFDRVYKPFLMVRLASIGVNESYLRFFDAYLAPRKGTVCVQGAQSEEFVLEDSVFQGTVLGPPLWNTWCEALSHYFL